MHIQIKYIDLIKNGIKKREYRLGKPERLKINVGDEIRLIANQDENNIIYVKVTGISLFKNWYDACKEYWVSDFKGLYNSFDELMEDCKNYYT